MKQKLAGIAGVAALFGGASAVPASADPGAGNGPACYHGQFTAADNQPNIDAFFKHLIYGIGCIYGVPPGQ